MAVSPAGGVDTSTSDVPVERGLADLATELFLDEPFLDEIVQLVRDKGQVVFYGPPGTGKTYVARKLAQWLAGSASRVRLVQFHPSYAYELNRGNVARVFGELYFLLEYRDQPVRLLSRNRSSAFRPTCASSPR